MCLDFVLRAFTLHGLLLRNGKKPFDHACFNVTASANASGSRCFRRTKDSTHPNMQTYCAHMFDHHLHTHLVTHAQLNCIFLKSAYANITLNVDIYDCYMC